MPTRREVAEHFDARAGAYSGAASWVNDHESLAPLGELFDRAHPSSVLELGSGTGAVPTYLHGTGRRPALYVAVDISLHMLAQQGVTAPVQADAAHLPIRSRTVDLVIARQAFHYFQEPARVLDEFRRVLAPQGRLVVLQIVPFDEEEDRQWWRRAVGLRQPLRSSETSAQSLTQDLVGAGFGIEAATFVERRSSLRSWLDRYPMTARARSDVVEHFRGAPTSVRDRRAFTGEGENVEYTIRWFAGTASAAQPYE